MQYPSVIIIHYGELSLKGKNRHLFEKQLERNIRVALTEYPVVIQREYGRMIIRAKNNVPLLETAKLTNILQQVFGIATIRTAYKVTGEYDAIETAVLELLSGKKEKYTFAVRARRTDKLFPVSGQEINVRLGARIAQQHGWTVDLTIPEKEISISVGARDHYISIEKQKGAGGLPVGTTGRFVSLLSSGIDSPVASYMMMKRGATLTYLHFHSYPITSQASIENVRQIVATLQRYQPPGKLILAPLAECQKKIVAQAPPRLRLLLYRHAMFDVAQRIAGTHRAKGLVTGESLGQVASQTIENMAAVTQGIELPILRPLIGCDKQEIITIAQRIGTYETSIEPYEDCCSLLTPPSVETKARLQDITIHKQRLPWEEMIAEVVANSETIAV